MRCSVVCCGCGCGMGYGVLCSEGIVLSSLVEQGVLRDIASGSIPHNHLKA